MAKEGKYVTLRLPSGEMRMVLATCWATIGQVGNLYYQNHRTLDDWASALDAGHLPIWRGHLLNRDDRIRRAVIRALTASGGSAAKRVSATSVSNDNGRFPAPRFCAMSRCHSFVRNRFIVTSRNVRNRRFSGSTTRSQSFASSRAKYSCVKS